MSTYLRFVLMVGIAAVIFIPIFKMLVDRVAQKVPAMAPVASFVDKA